MFPLFESIRLAHKNYRMPIHSRLRPLFLLDRVYHFPFTGTASTRVWYLVQPRHTLDLSVLYRAIRLSRYRRQDLARKVHDHCKWKGGYLLWQ
jgi:hypothetical protein